MWLFAAYIVWEVVNRLTSGGHNGHDHHEFEGGTVSVLGGLGIVVQLSIAYVLSRSSKRSLNVEGRCATSSWMCSRRRLWLSPVFWWPSSVNQSGSTASIRS